MSKLFFCPAIKWNSGRKTTAWNTSCMRLKIDWHKLPQNMCYWPPRLKNVAICFQKPQSFSWTVLLITQSPSPSPWPASSLLLPVHCFLISAPLPLHHLSLSPPVRATVPLPACLCWYSPLPLPLSMYFALIRREHRQTVLTAWARRGCCRGRETTAAVTAAWDGRRMEESGWRGGGGGCRATTLLSMTPNKKTEIGTGEEEVERGRRGWWGEAGECICEWGCLYVRLR